MTDDRQKNIFRKVMIDRLSSPDELTEMLRITKRADWLILAAMGLIVLTGLLWGSMAKLPITVAGEGILGFCNEQSDGGAGGSSAVRSGTARAHDSKTDVVLFVPETMIHQIHPGLEVRVMPEGYEVQQYGFLTGTVSEIGALPVDNGALAKSFCSADRVRRCITRHLRMEVRVHLQQNPAAPSEWKWTSGYSVPASSLVGTAVEGEIVLRKIHPIQWLLPWVR
jgi:hypothetical protein